VAVDEKTVLSMKPDAREERAYGRETIDQAPLIPTLSPREVQFPGHNQV
jgi:hypothetical protein